MTSNRHFFGRSCMRANLTSILLLVFSGIWANPRRVCACEDCPDEPCAEFTQYCCDYYTHCCAQDQYGNHTTYCCGDDACCPLGVGAVCCVNDQGHGTCYTAAEAAGKICCNGVLIDDTRRCCQGVDCGPKTEWACCRDGCCQAPSHCCEYEYCMETFHDGDCVDEHYYCCDPGSGDKEPGVCQWDDAAAGVKEICCYQQEQGKYICCDTAQGQSCCFGQCLPYSPCPECYSDSNCQTGQHCCNGKCQTDVCPNCGSSSSPCADGEYCCNGQCKTTPCGNCGSGDPCNAGENCCDGACQSASCSRCGGGPACGYNQSCCNGHCVTGSCTSCTSDSECSGGYCCNGVCQTEACGNCGSQPCAQGQYCCNGVCQANACPQCGSNPPCSSSENCCEGQCQSDPCDNCGTGGPCAAGQDCCNGHCAPAPCTTCDAGNPCSSGNCCNGVCQSEPCGDCGGQTCDAGQYCCNGVCRTDPCPDCGGGLPCGSSQYCCQGQCKATPCNNCGTTGGPCALGQDCCNGHCATAPCPQCNASTPCSSGYCCNGVCQPDPCGDCGGETCDPGEYCCNGVCQTDPCVDCGGLPCGSSQHCCDGQCQSGPCGDCGTEGPCSASQSCCNGHCVTGTCTGCTSSSQCSGGYCCNGVCQSDPCGDCDGQTCNQGEYCCNGDCQTEPCPHCGSGPPCGSSQYCCNGHCQTDPCGHCGTGDPCSADESCCNGQCVTGTCTDCTSSSQCGSGYCCNGVCQTESCGDCGSQTCADGLYCCNDECQTDPCPTCGDGPPCGSSQSCCNGHCRAEPCADCGTGGPCEPSEYCCHEQCQASACPCAQNSDCDAGTSCCNNKCDDDPDGDGIAGDCDSCPEIANSGQEDTDNDGVGDACDNCPQVANHNQADADNDGIGDACKPPCDDKCDPACNIPHDPDECPKGEPEDEPPADPDDSGSASCEDDDDDIDPVYLFSGEFYLEAVDLRIQGRGIDLVWARKYRSRLGRLTALGNEWDFSYNIYIQADANNRLVFDGNSRKDLFLLDARDPTNSTWIAHGFFQELKKNPDNTYTMHFASGGTWEFLPLDQSLTQGKIYQITDRNGNQVAFTYDAAGRLQTVTDSLNHTLTIAYNARNLIESVTDFTGRQVIYTYYQGEAGGSLDDLKSVTTPAVTDTPNGNDFPQGKTTNYTYSAGFSDEKLNHNLLTVTDPKGQTYLTNVYYPTETAADLEYDRIRRQIWGDPGDTIDLVYQIQAPVPANNNAVIMVIVNDRVGNVTEYFYDAFNRPALKREYTGRADPDLPTYPVGSPDPNRPAGKLRSTDPNYFETRYENNVDFLRTKVVHDDGSQIQYVYESENPDRRTRRNVREIRHVPPTGTGNTLVQKYEYKDGMGGCSSCGTNFVTRYEDPEGNLTLHDYDNNGNRTQTVRQSATTGNSVENFTYNAFGQLTGHQLPDDGTGFRRHDSYTYEYGYLVFENKASNGANLQTAYTRDTLGRATVIRDPRGVNKQFVYNQLDQVVREIQAPGTKHYVTDFYFDANNNLVRVDVENKDEDGNLGQNTHFTTTYAYDILNYRTLETREVDASYSINTSYAYDANRNQTLVTYGEYNQVQTLYDERDLVFKVIRAPGRPEQTTTQYDYDKERRVVQTTEALEGTPRITTNEYDAHGRLWHTTDPMGNVTTRTYDDNGLLLTEEVSGALADDESSAANVLLSKTTHVYDELGRQTSEVVDFFNPETPTSIDESITSTTYAPNGQVVQVTDDNGHATSTTYDTVGRAHVVTDARGNTTTYQYDENSNVTGITQVEKSDVGAADLTFQTTRQYDALNRLTETTDNAGNVTEFRYDSRGNQTRITDARGNVTRFEYDGLNRLITTTRLLKDEQGNPIEPPIVTTQVWDDNSRLYAQIDDKDNPTSYTYDHLNRRLSTIYADGTALTVTYDVNGTETRTDAITPTATVVTSTFDLLGRLKTRTITRGTDVQGTTSETYKYDGRSRVTWAQNFNGQDSQTLVTRKYDSLGSVLSESLQVGSLTAQVTAAVSDGVGNQTFVRYPGGREITTAYDVLNRKQTISDTAQIAHYDYVGPGRVERVSFANNVRLDYGYDNARRVTSTHHVFDPQGTPVTVDHQTYTWDAAYNKTGRTNVRTGVSRAYVYDSVNRMIRSTITPPGTPLDYTLDGVGNRTDAGYTMDDTDPPLDEPVNQYTSTPADERTYDANGNLTAISSQADPIRYNYRNEMVSYQDAADKVHTFLYDCFGRRVQKIIDAGGQNTMTLYLYNSRQIIEEQDASNVTQATYVYGAYVDEVLTMRRSGNNYYYHGDDLHTVMAVTNAAGAAVERYEYGDFGQPAFFDGLDQPLPDGTAIGNSCLFTGRQYDAETEFYYYRTRYLDPPAGRFTTRDTIGIWGDKLNLGNALAYVANNPCSSLDPGGLTKVAVCPPMGGGPCIYVDEDVPADALWYFWHYVFGGGSPVTLSGAEADSVMQSKEVQSAVQTLLLTALDGARRLTCPPDQTITSGSATYPFTGAGVAPGGWFWVLARFPFTGSATCTLQKELCCKGETRWKKLSATCNISASVTDTYDFHAVGAETLLTWFGTPYNISWNWTTKRTLSLESKCK